MLEVGTKRSSHWCGLRSEQLVLCDSLELDYCIPTLKREPDYKCSIMTKIDSRDTTGR